MKNKNYIMVVVIIVGMLSLGLSYKKVIEEDNVKIEKDKAVVANIKKEEDTKENDMIAIMVEGSSGYVSGSAIPTGNYEFNSSESYCMVNGVRSNTTTLSYDMTTGAFTVTPIATRGTKCYLYFDIAPVNVPSVMAAATLGERTDGWVSYSINGKTKNYTAGVYETNDTIDNSTVYYYSGDVQNNWVRFGDNGNGTCYYWRIIRTNTAAEGGGIRLLYAGSSTSCSGSVPVMPNAYINTSTKYYTSSNNSSYVGYMFTAGQQRGHGTQSTIKGVVDSWYTSSGLSNFASLINENAIYCNDRNAATNLGTYGTWRASGTQFSYKAGYRAGSYLNSSGTPTTDATVISPTLKCSNSEDKFSKGTAGGGNGYLSKPLALMTSDELIYAGAKAGNQSVSYYYYASDNTSSSTGSSEWWTMSPLYWYNGYAQVFKVMGTGQKGCLAGSGVYNSLASRPVVSLKSSISIYGSGTVNDPYVVE